MKSAFVPKKVLLPLSALLAVWFEYKNRIKQLAQGPAKDNVAELFAPIENEIASRLRDALGKEGNVLNCQDSQVEITLLKTQWDILADLFDGWKTHSVIKAAIVEHISAQLAEMPQPQGTDADNKS